jgi:hypothetical protein
MFAGFPEEALVFYEGLRADNTKAYWSDHKALYDSAVKAPMESLLAQLEPEFGKAKFFRPYRDVRFAKDKTPYKDHAGRWSWTSAPARSTCSCRRTGCTSGAATGTPRPTRRSGCGQPWPTSGPARSWSRCWPAAALGAPG